VNPKVVGIIVEAITYIAKSVGKCVKYVSEIWKESQEEEIEGDID
jgi:hypothetical protein